jgi:ABC-type transport system involved in cytochrome bd biosynthesis fused ATPase/permease subunit
MKKEMSKRIVTICLINGFAWVWCSYLLALIGREAIAESLSQAAIVEIIGVVLVYCLKSLFENLSKNNRWPDKPVEKEDETAEG